jgi:tetratricopeptide (TPR) repeat protein
MQRFDRRHGTADRRIFRHPRAFADEIVDATLTREDTGIQLRKDEFPLISRTSPVLMRVFEKGVSQQQRGRTDEAARLYQSILDRDPGHLGALQLLGVIHAQQGKLESAVTLLRKAAERLPEAAETRNNLGLALHTLGRHREAAACFEKAIALNPRYAIAHNNLGLTLVALDRRDEALTCYERALAISPDYPEAMNNLGAALHAARRFPEALGWFEKAVGIRPGFAEAQTNLGKALSALERYEEALAQLERAGTLRPDLAANELDLGSVLRALNRYDEAIRHYEKAAAIAPAQALPAISLGVALQEIGRTDEARRYFEKAVALEPRNPAGYACLVGAVKTRAGDPHLPVMEALAKDLSGSLAVDRAVLHFALGKALSDVGEHQRGFDHYREGNALKRWETSYDETATVGRLDRILGVFTAELMRRNQGLGDPCRTPIFIVGMPRSGSTLVEQILASHPRVFGAGERSDFRNAVRSAGLHGGGAEFPRSVPAVTGTQLRSLARSYLTTIGAVGAGTPAMRVTDKLPANFRYAGLIHLALPNARIIHTCRDPIDTCLSCFATLFEKQPFTFDLGELGRYYSAYTRLMKHWREVLPEGVMLDVQYEELVYDFEPQARRILAHCGLEWDDDCLSFHQAKRPVKTASMTQVRQPIYRSSVGRWRPDDETLRPLYEGMGLAAADLPVAVPAEQFGKAGRSWRN